jgi:hypothetical protein
MLAKLLARMLCVMAADQCSSERLLDLRWVDESRNTIEHGALCADDHTDEVEHSKEGQWAKTTSCCRSEDESGLIEERHGRLLTERRWISRDGNASRCGLSAKIWCVDC